MLRDLDLSSDDFRRYLPLGVDAEVLFDKVAGAYVIMELSCTQLSVSQVRYDPAVHSDDDPRLLPIGIRRFFSLDCKSGDIKSTVLASLLECVRELKEFQPGWPWVTPCGKCGSFSCDFVNCEPVILKD